MNMFNSTFLPRKLAALFLVASTNLGTAFADTAIIAGGGYDLHGSQAQIELNVKWVQQVLQRAGLSVHTFFTDGGDEAFDVYRIAGDVTEADDGADAKSRVPYEALARVFRNYEEAKTQYYNNTVPENAGTTRADILLPALSEILSANSDSDTDSVSESPPLFIYNGHGGPSRDKPDEVTLKLWENTSVTAREFHALLEERSTDLRFVFTQCYSGGFHRLAYKNSSSGLELADSTRCGFTAESAWRLAEGCSASVESRDYRDYTTYFFAALDGLTRDGESLTEPVVDTEGADGAENTGLRDAHLYTLQHAHSTDLSRSTSEDFLISWQPWLERWLPVSDSLPANEYSVIAESLATRLGLDGEDTSGRAIRKQLKKERENLASIEKKISEQRDSEYWDAWDLQKMAIEKWPFLAAPYTDGYARLASSGLLQEISDWLSALPRYQSLLQNQNQLQSLYAEQLAAERQLTQWYKLLHLRKLSRLKSDLYVKGDVNEIESYERLVACESQPLSREGKSLLTDKPADPLQVSQQRD